MKKSESVELQTVYWPPPDGTRADFCDVGQKRVRLKHSRRTPY